MFGELILIGAVATSAVSTWAGLTLLRRQIQLRAEAYSRSCAYPMETETVAVAGEGRPTTSVVASKEGLPLIIEDRRNIDVDPPDGLEKRRSARRSDPLPV
jgi:hypothetical protein